MQLVLSPLISPLKSIRWFLATGRLLLFQPNMLKWLTLSLSHTHAQQQRKEREMVRQQQDKAPHRRLDDMRREEDRRMAEREQVTNHSQRTAAGRPITAERGCSTQHSSGPGMSVEWLPWQQSLKRSVCVCVWMSRVQPYIQYNSNWQKHKRPIGMN